MPVACFSPAIMSIELADIFNHYQHVTISAFTGYTPKYPQKRKSPSKIRKALGREAT
jgi:hypothetical protein